jgi:hypothetical protein
VQRPLQRLEFTVVGRHAEKVIGKVWSFQSFEMLKALEFFGSKHHHGGFAVFGHRLWFAPRRLNDLAEPILGVLDRPIATNHGLTF